MDEVITINTELHGDTSKIDFCKIIKENSKWYRNNRGEKYKWTDILRTVLSTKLPEEVYHGIIDFMQSLRDNASAIEIQNALVNYKNIDFNDGHEKEIDIFRLNFLSGVHIWAQSNNMLITRVAFFLLLLK